MRAEWPPFSAQRLYTCFLFFFFFFVFVFRLFVFFNRIIYSFLLLKLYTVTVSRNLPARNPREGGGGVAASIKKKERRIRKKLWLFPGLFLDTLKRLCYFQISVSIGSE